MRRALVLSAALFAAVRVASAQDPLTAAKKAAQKAAAATNAHIEAEQRPDQRSPTPAPTKPAASTQRQAPGTERPGTRLAVPTTDTAGPPPTILREVFAYDRAGRRDPFMSLLSTNELRPTLSDLKLTGVLVELSGRRSVATLRDLATNAVYKVTTGSTLGRMRVSAIKSSAVVFTIEEFGTTRQDSLVLRDSTKVRRP